MTNFHGNLTPPDKSGDNRGGLESIDFGYGETVKGSQTKTPSGDGAFVMRDGGNWERHDRVSTVKG